MQFRPLLIQSFNLKKQFTGTTQMGSYNIWVSLGNYLDFEGGRNHLHRHSFYEACLVLEGSGILIHEKKEHIVCRGDLFITPPGLTHEIISDGSDHLKIQFVYFSFELALTERNDATALLYNQYIAAFLNSNRTVIPFSENQESLYIRLRDASEENSYAIWHLESEGICRNLILDIILKAAECFPQDFEKPDSDSRLQLALRYIHDNPFRKLTVEEIAFQAHTTPRTLRRLMAGSCGMTVVQKCLTVRIEESARYIITHKEKSIAEIAYIFQFANPSDFGREFKKIMKCPPGRYRQAEGTCFIKS